MSESIVPRGAGVNPEPVDADWVGRLGRALTREERAADRKRIREEVLPERQASSKRRSSPSNLNEGHLALVVEKPGASVYPTREARRQARKKITTDANNALIERADLAKKWRRAALKVVSNEETGLNRISNEERADIQGTTFNPERIKELLQHLCYSQARLAEIIGTTSVTVSTWMHKSRPSADFLMRIQLLADFHDVAGFNPLKREPWKSGTPRRPVSSLTEEQLHRIRSAEFEEQSLKGLIKAMHYSQYQLAVEIGTSAPNVSRWLQGRQPSADFLSRMQYLAELRGVGHISPLKGTSPNSLPAPQVAPAAG